MPARRVAPCLFGRHVVRPGVAQRRVARDLGAVHQVDVEAGAEDDCAEAFGLAIGQCDRDATRIGHHVEPWHAQPQFGSSVSSSSGAGMMD